MERDSKIKKEVIIDEDTIIIGDRVNIDLQYGDEEVENMNLILTENTFDFETGEVSINSAIGAAIYLQKVGYDDAILINNIKVKITVNKKIVKEKKLEI